MVRASKNKWARGGMLAPAIVGLAAAGLLLSACSSSSKADNSGTSGSSGASAAQSPTGTPIKVMTIFTSTGTAVSLNPEAGTTAQIYGKWINAHGGVAGHPLDVTTCDDQGTQTQAATCAHQAVTDHDVAVVSSLSIAGGEEILPILQQAGIAYLGDPTPAFPQDGTSPVSFPAYGILPQNAAQMALAYQNGCKKVSIVVNAGGTATLLKPVYQAAATAYGETLGQIVQVAATSGDYSPYVTQALEGGTDCVVTAIGTQQFASFIPAWAQASTKAVLYSGGGQLSPASIPKGLTSVVNGSYNVSTIPDISVPALADYRNALATYNAPKSGNYDSVTGVGAWIGYVLFKNIAATIQGPITSATFLAAANSATAVSSDGILPVINFSKPWTSGPKGLLRSFNCGVTYQKLENGKFVTSTADFQNAAALLTGSGKLGAPLPATSPGLACQS